MSRKNIFETLIDKYDIGLELYRIMVLFNKPAFFRYLDSEKGITIEKIVEIYKFHSWKARCGCLDCSDMRKSLGLISFPKTSENTDEILTYMEYYINICSLVSDALDAIQRDEYEKTSAVDMLTTNIINLVDNLNHDFLEIKDEEKILIIPKNPAMTAAAEVSSLPTGIAILKYHHRLLQGDLTEKRKILETIATEHEEMLKSGEPFEIFNKTKGLLNNLGIRHGNKTNKENVAKFSKAELEKWYDEVYQMLLLCILLNENKPRMQKVDELLKSLKHQ